MSDMLNKWAIQFDAEGVRVMAICKTLDGKTIVVDKSPGGEWQWVATNWERKKIAGSHLFNSLEEGLVDAEMWRRGS